MAIAVIVRGVVWSSNWVTAKPGKKRDNGWSDMMRMGLQGVSENMLLYYYVLSSLMALARKVRESHFCV